MNQLLLFLLIFPFFTLANTYTVTTAAFGTTADGISLQWAITQANANPGPDNIEFNISGATPHTITATAAYPFITGANAVETIIDASTQPLNGGSAANKKIELVGAAGFDCFTVNVANFECYGFYINGYRIAIKFNNAAADNFIIGSTVSGKGNVISNNFEDGIHLNGDFIDGGAIINNYIGVDETGNVAQGNTDYGIYIDDRARTTTISNNVIANNGSGGIFSRTNGFGGDSGFTMENNYIGVSATGLVAMGNGGVGISIGMFVENVLIADNVISNNSGGGVAFRQKITDVTVRDNIIGSNLTGTAIMGNTGDGISATANTSTGTIIEDNLISNSTGYGIYMAGISNRFNSFIDNKIGTNIAGTLAMPNTLDGIRFEGTTLDNSLVKGNLISGNLGDGIVINAPDCDFDTIIGNYIGVDITGTIALGNGGDGLSVIDIHYRSSVIGTVNAGEGNIISSNGGSGIHFESGSGQSNRAVIQGNFIGTDATGNLDLGNGGHGILISTTPTGGQSWDNNTIDCNIIAYNTNEGIEMIDVNTIRNPIRGNKIFCNAQAGTQKGIEINATAQNNTPAPVILTANSTTLTGTAINKAIVEIFMSDNAAVCGGNQAEHYVDNVEADASGNWSYTVTSPITQISGNITVVAIDTFNNTSEISTFRYTGSPFSLTNIPDRCSSPVVVPIQLSGFNAVCISSNVVAIEWTTLSEINNDYFTIEKSKDGFNFIEVKRVLGAGNSNGVRNYSLIDNNNDGYQYYRLKQTDFNGKFEYFKVVAIEGCGGGNDVIIYPNPANDLITLSVAGKKGLFEVQIFSAIGQLMIANKFDAEVENTQYTVKTSELATGIYFVNLYQGASHQIQKLIIE